MKEYFYYKTIRRTIIQFLDVFNDINIARYDNEGNELKRVNVPIRFGPKSKAYLFIREQQKYEEKLPMISVSLQSIEFDSERMSARHENIVVSKNIDNRTVNFYKNAVPYNLGFTLTMWTLHMVDVDQIYEQILPYFAPHAFIRVSVPELDTIVEVKVILDSCTPDITNDVSEEEVRIIKWDTSFTVQTWLFKPITDSAIIDKIYINYYTEENNWGRRNTNSTIVSTGSIPPLEYSPSNDDEPSQSTALIGLGYDDDAKLMFEYEVF